MIRIAWIGFHEEGLKAFRSVLNKAVRGKP